MFRRSQQESTPLLRPSNAIGDESSKKYYFINKQQGDYMASGAYNNDGIPVMEAVPEGTTEDEFAPRLLQTEIARNPRAVMGGRDARSGSASRGFWSWLLGSRNSSFGGGGTSSTRSAHQEQQVALKLRKAPIKIEPKVFFANERTFLAWMHLSVILAGASIAILAFAQDSNPYSQLYGVVLLPVAISFIVYSMYQYNRRAAMIRTRHPGPYEDTVGPVVLAIMLMISILAQFAMKLYAMST